MSNYYVGLNERSYLLCCTVSSCLITPLFPLPRGPDLDSPGDGDGDGVGRGGGGDSPGDSPGPSHRPHPSSSVMKKTAQQIAGERVLSRVVEEVEGVSFSFK